MANTVANRTVRAVSTVPIDNSHGPLPLPDSLVVEIETLIPGAERVDVETVASDVAGPLVSGLPITVATDEILPFLGLGDTDLDQLREVGAAVPPWIDGFFELSPVFADAAILDADFDLPTDAVVYLSLIHI